MFQSWGELSEMGQLQSNIGIAEIRRCQTCKKKVSTSMMGSESLHVALGDLIH